MTCLHLGKLICDTISLLCVHTNVSVRIIILFPLILRNYGVVVITIAIYPKL